MERDHLSKQLDAIEKIEYQLNDSIELIKMAEEVGDDETVEESNWWAAQEKKS